METIETKEFADVAALNTFTSGLEASLIRTIAPVFDSAGVITMYVLTYVLEVLEP